MTDKPRRMTEQTLVVLRELVADSTVGWYGHELSKRTGLRHSTVYGVLVKLEDCGWLRHREEANPVRGKPARTVYHLTHDGAEHARDAITQADHRARSRPRRIPAADPAGYRSGPAWGLAT